MALNSDGRFDHLEDKVDGLQDKIGENHLEILGRLEKLTTDNVARIHAVESTVQKHEQHFSTLNKIFFSGSIVSLVAFFKDFFVHK